MTPKYPRALPRLGSLILIVLTAMAAGCGGTLEEAEHPSVEEAVPAAIAPSTRADPFIIWEHAQNYYLITQILPGSTISVCLIANGVDSLKRLEYEGHIRSAILAWVAGARPASTTPLITSPNITFSCPSSQLTVNWYSVPGRARAGQGWINLFSDDGYETVLHEFGHVFGIGDTYVEGVWTCQPGQPSSVMCNGYFSTLQRDDLQAIQEVFCMAFGDRCNRRSFMGGSWCGHAGAQLHVGDFNGDSRTDMLCHDPYSGHKWIAHANTSGSFSWTTWNGNLGGGWCYGAGQLRLGDFNGDGRTDMLCHDPYSGYKWIAHANGDGQFPSTTWEGSLGGGWCNHSGAQLHVGDFNGDGRADLLCHDTQSGYKWIAHANGYGQFPNTTWEGDLGGGWCHGNGQLHLGDFNGDGRTDMLCHDTQSGYTRIAHANGYGQFSNTTWEGDLGGAWCNHPGTQLLVGDFNGDSREDLLCHDRNSGHKWIAFADWSGAVPGTSRSWGMRWCAFPGGQMLMGDFDGNTATDFLCHNTANGNKWFAYMVP